MKNNTIWVLVSGLAVGFLIGREFGKKGDDTGGKPSSEAAQSAKGKEASPTETPSTWIKAEEIGGADLIKGLTPAQVYLVNKAMNDKPCDCGCPHGNFAKCKKEDPGCPRAPQVLAAAAAAAKEGKNYDQILEAIKKPAGGGAAAAEPTSAKIEVAAWSPIKGPKFAKVTIIEYSDFQ